MEDPKIVDRATHEIGRIYDSIMDRQVLCDFFLETACRFISADHGFLFLSGNKKYPELQATSGGKKKLPLLLLSRVKRHFSLGRPVLWGHSLFLPLIVRNHSLGIVYFGREKDKKRFSKADLETGFNLASEFSGAYKSAVLAEENIRMEKQAAVGRSMGAVAREIDSILRLARFADDTIREGLKGSSPKGVERGLGMLRRTLQEAEGFICDALSFSADRQPEFVLMDMSKLFDELALEFGSEAGKRGIQLHLEIEPGFPAVEIAPRFFFRILFNLVKNSLVAFGNRHKRQVSVIARMINPSRYELIVEDNAGGMPEELQKKVFETFFSTKGAQGTGLGLMAVAHIVKMHQGTAKVESKLGVGTKFVMSFPRIFKK